MEPLTWASLTPYAILKDNTLRFSGRVMDVLVNDNTIILATAFGGLWAIDTDKQQLEGFVTHCLTDTWDDPNVNSLVHGPDKNTQMYAGCEKTLYYLETQTDEHGTTASFSVIINLPVSNVDTIYRIVVQKEKRRIILATGAGVWWSSIPPDPKIATAYTWKKAMGLSGNKIPGLCSAAGDALHASVWGNSAAGEFGIFKGVFKDGELWFTKSQLHWTDGVSESDMARVSLASCLNKPDAAFAVCSKQDDSFRGVLQYDAAKDKWIDNLNTHHIHPFPGNQGGFNNCIAVAPDNSGLVVFGWQKGTFILTGGNWKWLSDPTTHSDIHALQFTHLTAGVHTLFIGGDGGILKVTAPAEKHPKFDDRLNVFLPTLLFKDSLRRAYATTDVSPVVDGLISGGLQDNGVKFLKTAAHKYSDWQSIIGADGGTNTFLANGVLISRESNPGNKFKSSAWNHQQNSFNPSAAIPLPVSIKTEPRMEICTRIPLPAYRNKKNQLIHAVSAAVKDADNKNIVLGLFADDENATGYHWEIIGNSPTLVTAAASVDGR